MELSAELSAELYPGVHLITGLRWSNSYLLVEPDGLTLIDSGLPGDGKKILHYIQHIGRKPEELRQVIVTHSHPDHVGPLKRLAEQTGAAVAVHRADTRPDKDGQHHHLHYSAQLPAITPYFPFMHRIPAQQLIEDGELLPTLGGLQALHTPGHTAGSICLYQPQEGLLFTGDTLLADGHDFRRPLPFPGTSFCDYRASVERLAQLPFEMAFVGHGEPVLSGGNARLRDMLDRHYFWLDQCWRRLKRRAFHC